MESNDTSTDFKKYFPCRIIEGKMNELDSSDEAFETANEYSDDEDNQLIIQGDYE